MLLDWLSPLLTWTGLSLIELLVLAFIIIHIIKD